MQAYNGYGTDFSFTQKSPTRYDFSIIVWFYTIHFVFPDSIHHDLCRYRQFTLYLVTFAIKHPISHDGYTKDLETVSDNAMAVFMYVSSI